MSQSAFDVTVHTDGACSGNPGPGGWAAVLSAGTHHKEIAGRVAHTTNNEMELMAVLEALRAIKHTGLSVAIYADSQLVIGWLTGAYKVKADHIAELVRAIKTMAEAKFLAIDWFHVKGHSGNAGNERANRLAQNEARIAKRVVAKKAHRTLCAQQ
jgi:ribonuclease HI